MWTALALEPRERELARWLWLQRRTCALTFDSSLCDNDRQHAYFKMQGAVAGLLRTVPHNDGEDAAIHTQESVRNLRRVVPRNDNKGAVSHANTLP